MANGEVIATGRPATASLLVPSRNCWRLERAARLSFLIDGDAYFRALRDVFARARHSIFIVAWDIDSRTVLVPDGATDGLPAELGDFLDALVIAAVRHPGPKTIALLTVIAAVLIATALLVHRRLAAQGSDGAAAS